MGRQVEGDDDEKMIEQANNSLKTDLSDTETQPVENDRFSPPQLHGGKFEMEKDGLQYAVQDALPVHDAFPFGDAFETQMVDFDDETQVMDLPGETQVVDFGGETQVMDLPGETWVVDFGGETQVMDLPGETQVVDLGGETQVLDVLDTEVQIDSDGEGSDKTEVLSDTEVLSNDNLARKGGHCSDDLENTLDIEFSKQGDGGSNAQLDALSNEEHCSGSIVRAFTSIHAASTTASGLAAHNMAIKSINISSCVNKHDDFLEPLAAEKDKTYRSIDSPKLTDELNQKRSMKDYDPQIKELGNQNTHKVGSSAVRKLFMDDVVSEIRQEHDGRNSADGTGGAPQFALEHDFAGLSYVNSQEPGDLSQANALDVVDKFLELNATDCNQDVALKKSTEGKSKPVSGTKGTQSLAKKAAVRSIDGEKGIFNWDDDLEDEGGGEFFQKKKEQFFENGRRRQRSNPHSRKPPYLNSKNRLTIPQNRDKKEHADCNVKFKDAVLSDSRLLSQNLRSNESSKLRKSSFKKNLLMELEEEINDASAERVVDDGTGKHLPEKMDAGFDTQMAADAMEALQFAGSVTDNDCNNFDEGTVSMIKSAHKDEADDRSSLNQNATHKRACASNGKVITRQSKKARRTGVKSSKELSTSSQSKNLRKQSDAELIKRERKRAKLDLKDLATNGSENLSTMSKVVRPRKEDRVSVGSDLDKINGMHVTASAGRKSLERRPLQEELDSLTRIACRTRGSAKANQSKGGNNLNISSVQTDVGELAHGNVRKIGQSNQGGHSNVNISALDYPKRRRTRSKLPLVGQEGSGQYTTGSKISKCDVTSTSIDPVENQKEQASVSGGNNILANRIDQGRSVLENTSNIQENVVKAQISKHRGIKRDTDNTRFAEGLEPDGSEEASPKDRFEPVASASKTPVSCTTPVSAASPICMGDEYRKQSCRRNLLRSSLMKELNSITSTTVPEFTSPVKDLRRRRDMTTVRAMLSRHLDADIIKQQKKILSRLGASVASSMSDATHFVTDEFVRTRNMLEAIAFGKPVVTHLWLESCGQANCFIDERNYILRDARKEKEFGFSMPVSLSRACQHPLLQGQRVLITPNTKPDKEILENLVKAVHGLAVERFGRSAWKDERLPDDILVLSCEEDYEICVPFLEKGASVYSSELLLNGIVIQKLEYERHRLFTDNVKRTRSTIWLKKNNTNQYLPVTKSK